MKYHITTTHGAVHYLDTDARLLIRKAASDTEDFEPAEINYLGPDPEPEVGASLVVPWRHEDGRLLYRISTPIVHFEEVE